MIIQPFVENALWHGLQNKKGERILKISFYVHNNKSLKCVVDDNGTGRKENTPQDALYVANNPVKSKSLGLAFTSERLSMMSHILAVDCGFTIIDKKNEQGQALGTRAEIIVPLINQQTI